MSELPIEFLGMTPPMIETKLCKLENDLEAEI